MHNLDMGTVECYYVSFSAIIAFTMAGLTFKWNIPRVPVLHEKIISCYKYPPAPPPPRRPQVCLVCRQVVQMLKDPPSPLPLALWTERTFMFSPAPTWSFSVRHRYGDTGLRPPANLQRKNSRTGTTARPRIRTRLVDAFFPPEKNKNKMGHMYQGR